MGARFVLEVKGIWEICGCSMWLMNEISGKHAWC